jgi:hypothetical protein
VSRPRPGLRTHIASAFPQPAARQAPARRDGRRWQLNDTHY